MQKRELIPRSETAPFDRRDMRDSRFPGEKKRNTSGRGTQVS
jgi:hypothetical protein